VLGVVAGVATAVIGVVGCDCLDSVESEWLGSGRGDVEDDAQGAQLVCPGLGVGSRASEPFLLEKLEDSGVMLIFGPGVSTNSA
jgi:hypothetical protein